MMDTRRWVLVETWLALDLRVQWMPRWDVDKIPQDDWQEDDVGVRYIYEGASYSNGAGTWLVLRQAPRYGEVLTDSPVLSVDAMVHELAHWLASTEEERAKRNFGAKSAVGGDPANNEDRALLAQKAIEAMLGSCGRIASLALAGPRTR